MNEPLVSSLSVILAYLAGSIPFGYLIGKAAGGIDVRTVGSKNIGATNVGRTLGFRFFLLVFVLDAAKGFLPTFFLPRGAAALVGHPLAYLPALVALASILGHNFPIFLRFKGGKGVATSLGAVFALDAVAGAAAVAGFLVVLVLTRMVSMGSIGGGLAFVGVHFLRTPRPFSGGESVMSATTLVMMAMIVYRHRKNLGRIAAGTEPRVNFRRKTARPGRVRVGLILVVVALAAGTGLAVNAARRPELIARGRRIAEVARMATGHQRADRVIFFDRGRSLAVTCPRYMRVVLASIDDARRLAPVADIRLQGRPVALAAGADRVYVLQRPHADARHLEEAWWETFDFAGRPVGERVRVGWDPDDLALSADGRFAYVITSGHAEGETNRPAPALTVYDLSATPVRALGRVDLDGPKDDPERLRLLDDGRAAVSLRGSNAVVRLDLRVPDAPEIVDRTPAPSPCVPDAIASTTDGRLLVGDPEASAFWVSGSGGFTPVDVDGGVADLVEADGLIFATLPRGSGLAVLEWHGFAPLGKLPIRGTANLATTRPLGIAHSPERKLLAVTNRAGGSVHLIALDGRDGADGLGGHRTPAWRE